MQIPRFAVLLSVVAVVAAGCGDDNDGNGSTSGATQAAQSAKEHPSGPPVKLMVITSADTPALNRPELPAAAEAAALAINERGGMKGRPVEVTFCNDQANPNVASQCARRAVNQSYTAVVGGYSIYGDSVLPVLEKGRVPAVGWWPVQPADFRSPIAYLLFSGVPGQYGSLPRVLKEQGATEIATVVSDVPTSAAVAQVVEQGIKASGAEHAGAVAVPLNATDYAPYAAELDETGADAAVFILPAGSAIQMLRAINQAGSQIKVGIPDGLLTTNEISDLGASGEGVLLTGPLPPVSEADDYPELKRFVDEYEAAESGGEIEEDLPLSTGAALTWLAVQAVDKIGGSVKDLDGQKLIAATNKAKDVELGPIPPWTPNAPGPPSFPRISNPFVYSMKVEDGTTQLLEDKPMNPFGGT